MRVRARWTKVSQKDRIDVLILEIFIMKRAIIVHCWDGYPTYCWYPDTKKELEEKGFEVVVPALPDTNLPDQNKWLPALREVIGETNQDTYLVGHSAGCITILRYLESLAPNQHIGGVVLVAGFTDNLGFKELESFFSTPINFEKIKKHCSRFVLIHSDNDPFVDLKYGYILSKELDGKLIVKHNAKHFSGAVDNTESCTSLPEVAQSIVGFTSSDKN